MHNLYFTLFVAHGAEVATFTTLSLFAYFVCLNHPYILLISLEIFLVLLAVILLCSTCTCICTYIQLLFFYMHLYNMGKCKQNESTLFMLPTVVL